MNLTDEEIGTLYDAAVTYAQCIQDDIDDGCYEGDPESLEFALNIKEQAHAVATKLHNELFPKEQT